MAYVSCGVIADATEGAISHEEESIREEGANGTGQALYEEYSSHEAKAWENKARLQATEREDSSTPAAEKLEESKAIPIWH